MRGPVQPMAVVWSTMPASRAAERLGLLPHQSHIGMGSRMACSALSDGDTALVTDDVVGGSPGIRFRLERQLS